jgi:hypothetical protein
MKRQQLRALLAATHPPETPEKRWHDLGDLMQTFGPGPCPMCKDMSQDMLFGKDLARWAAEKRTGSRQQKRKLVQDEHRCCTCSDPLASIALRISALSRSPRGISSNEGALASLLMLASWAALPSEVNRAAMLSCRTARPSLRKCGCHKLYQAKFEVYGAADRVLYGDTSRV